MSDEVELSIQQRYVLRMSVVGFVCIIILVFWMFAKMALESSPAVNLWLMDFYESVVAVIVWGGLFIGFIISLLMACLEKD